MISFWPGHEPNKLIKADVPVPVLVDHVHHVLELLLGGRPAKGSHHLAELLGADGATAVSGEGGGGGQVWWKAWHSYAQSVALRRKHELGDEWSSHLSKKENMSLYSFSMSVGSFSAAWNGQMFQIKYIFSLLFFPQSLCPILPHCRTFRIWNFLYFYIEMAKRNIVAFPSKWYPLWIGIEMKKNYWRGNFFPPFKWP